MVIEGIVAKKLDSVYLPGTRSQDWIKIKKSLKLDLAVGGYIPGKGGRAPYFGGPLLGAYSPGSAGLRPGGHTGRPPSRTDLPAHQR